MIETRHYANIVGAAAAAPQVHDEPTSGSSGTKRSSKTFVARPESKAELSLSSSSGSTSSKGGEHDDVDVDLGKSNHLPPYSYGFFKNSPASSVRSEGGDDCRSTTSRGEESSGGHSRTSTPLPPPTSRQFLSAQNTDESSRVLLVKPVRREDDVAAAVLIKKSCSNVDSGKNSHPKQKRSMFVKSQRDNDDLQRCVNDKEPYADHEPIHEHTTTSSYFDPNARDTSEKFTKLFSSPIDWIGSRFNLSDNPTAQKIINPTKLGEISTDRPCSLSPFDACKFPTASDSGNSSGSAGNSAIQAMESFIKNSFAPGEPTKATTPRRYKSTLVSRFPPMSTEAAGTGSRATYYGGNEEDTSRSVIKPPISILSCTAGGSGLYRNKYLSPVYFRDRSDPPEIMTTTTSSSINATRSSEILSPNQLSTSLVHHLESSPADSELDHPRKCDKMEYEEESVNRDISPLEGLSSMSCGKDGTTSTEGVNCEQFECRKSNVEKHSGKYDSEENLNVSVKYFDTEKPCDTNSVMNVESAVKKFESSSAIESLQGLVYGQSLHCEHPIDSFERLANRKRGLEAVDVVDPTVVPLPTSGTFILVNPIVAFVPPGVPGTLSVDHLISIQSESQQQQHQLSSSFSSTSPRDRDSSRHDHRPSSHSPATATDITPPQHGEEKDHGGKHLHGLERHSRLRRHPSTPSLSPTRGADNRENDYDRVCVYRCRACRRKFSSKGSYRYHLSRCHTLTSTSEKDGRVHACSGGGGSGGGAGGAISDAVKKNKNNASSAYYCVPLDACGVGSGQFAKYYKMAASELGTTEAN